MTEELALKIKMLPESPGCYLMKSRGAIIYVGKAVNLKNRVRSYFHGHDHTPKVRAMVSHIDDFDVMLCQTNLEALILECNLIKLHRPYYNILLKDDKHYPYVRIDLNEPFPRVTVARAIARDGAKYFGPYTGATAVRDVLEVLRRVFPLRTCKKALPLSRPARPCVHYEIGHCLAPCAGKCTAQEYDAVVRRVIAFLGGKSREIVEELRAQMASAARDMAYEKAARLRDCIRDIEALMERQRAIQTSGADQDVLAAAQDGLDAMAQVMFVRGGHMVGGEHFPLPGEGNEPPGEVLAAFLTQYYEERPPAREVLCMALPEGEHETLEKWLAGVRGGAVRLHVPQRGDKRALTLLAEKNARDALEKRNARAQIELERTLGACRALGEALGLDKPPRRIEGFDISNTQGTLSVASQVVFIDGAPAKKEYRHYRIKTVVGANDFASMNEVLGRRFRRLSENPQDERPDLILIDGGPEQLAFARRAMLAHGLEAPMFGLAKRLEEIYLPGTPAPIVLDRRSSALHLIQRIRDEAHRFAITHHRALRAKASTHSRLEDIPGVGPARRRALLAKFRTIAAIREASLEELAATGGVSRPAAAAVYAWAHPGEKGETT